MHRYLGRFSAHAYAALRIVAGFLFACHGAQKLLGWFGGQSQELLSLMGLAGIIELVGGLLIMIGLFTSWAAFFSSGQMAFAYFMAHQKQGALPIQNGGELAALYAFLFLFMATRGSGLLSLDSLLFKKKAD